MDMSGSLWAHFVVGAAGPPPGRRGTMTVAHRPTKRNGLRLNARVLPFAVFQGWQPSCLPLLWHEGGTPTRRGPAPPPWPFHPPTSTMNTALLNAVHFRTSPGADP